MIVSQMTGFVKTIAFFFIMHNLNLFGKDKLYKLRRIFLENLSIDNKGVYRV